MPGVLSVVERYLAALAVQDWAALAATLEPDVERTGPYGDVYQGRTPYVDYLRAVFRTLAGYELSVTRCLVAGDVVVVELSETVDAAGGRRRTEEAVVFDVSSAELIRRIGVYLRR
ncbi:MAG TPA: nuclear transport factor 2 family protein [Candidatus Limnocylindria bacterium]|nr:nuclear transport factor 2 family protein [Candidatus Limnocylindria bacterium]